MQGGLCEAVGEKHFISAAYMRLGGCRVYSVVLVSGYVRSGAGQGHLPGSLEVGRALRSLKDGKGFGGLAWESLTRSSRHPQTMRTDFERSGPSSGK